MHGAGGTATSTWAAASDSRTIVVLLLATGVSAAFALLALVFAALLRWPTRWRALALMGVLETGYCALMVAFYRAPDEASSLTWIQIISVFMPFMTWIVTYYTVDIAELRDHFMARFSKLTLWLTIAFAVAMLADVLLGTHRL